MSAPRKVNPSEVQVLDADGGNVSEAGMREPGVRVVQAGPWGLLMLPVMLALFVVLLPILALVALLFGRSIFRVFSGRIGPGWMR
jgi:hypothetical protein